VERHVTATADTGGAATEHTLATLLAERLGLAPDQVASGLGGNPLALFDKDPLAAALVLSMTPPARPTGADPAALVRLVAAIVGACPCCLGEAADCAECNGRGSPGSRAPDGGALIAWTARPFRRLGLCVGIPRRPTAGYPQAGPTGAGDTQGGGYG
jgi:hypothetical protein